MIHLIDKDALVAKIERWIELLTNEKSQEGASQIDKLSLGGRIAELQEVKVLLDILEVKEVDLEKELQSFFYPHVPWGDYCKNGQRDIKEWSFKIAKHFFELGLAQKGEEV